MRANEHFKQFYVEETKSFNIPEEKMQEVINKIYRENREDNFCTMAARINSHGFIGYLMGEYDLKETPTSTKS